MSKDKKKFKWTDVDKKVKKDKRKEKKEKKDPTKPTQAETWAKEKGLIPDNKLGSATRYVFNNPIPEILDTFENPNPKQDYVIAHHQNEFTSLCPKTGQPDYGNISITYIPKKVCIETKSLKLYLMAYRNEGAFMEDMVNQIANDLESVLSPKCLTVSGWFNSRGGISTTVTVERGKQA